MMKGRKMINLLLSTFKKSCPQTHKYQSNHILSFLLLLPALASGSHDSLQLSTLGHRPSNNVCTHTMSLAEKAVILDHRRKASEGKDMAWICLKEKVCNPVL